MALVFMDGFDHYDDGELFDKWTSGGGGGFLYREILSPGRNGYGNYLRIRSSSSVDIYKEFPSNYSTIVVGFAFRTNNTSSGYEFMRLSYYGSQECNLRVSSGRIVLYRGGTWLAQSSSTITNNSWNYIEFKVYSHDSSGTAQVKLNGVLEIDYSGDTRVSGNISRIHMYAGAVAQNDYDDLYVLNGSGSVNNDWIGDCRIELLSPNGAGNETDWTPSTGSNWENVDDTTTIDDDSTYNYVGSGGGFPANDLYTLGNLTTTLGEVYAVGINSYVRKDDGGSTVLTNILRTGGTTYSGLGDVGAGDNYAFMTDYVEENPDTATAWTVSEVNSLETGIRRVS